MSAPPNGKGPRRHWAPLGTPEGNGVLTGLGTALAGVVPLLALLALMTAMTERLERKTGQRAHS